jgi:hypothetical protein
MLIAKFFGRQDIRCDRWKSNPAIGTPELVDFLIDYACDLLVKIWYMYELPTDETSG